MAELLKNDQLKKEIQSLEAKAERLRFLLTKMSAKTRVCVKCETLREDIRRDERCWCDYESGDIR